MKINPRLLTPGVLLQTALIMCAQNKPAPLSIEVGTHYLSPDRPDQTVEVRVRGGRPVAGVNFKIQVADGFFEVRGSRIDGPDIARVDLVGTGSGEERVFSNNHTPANNPGSGSQLGIRSVTTKEKSVIAEGVLAAVTFDASGFEQGEFDLKMKDTVFGSTEFFDEQGFKVPVKITNGSLVIAAAPKLQSRGVDEKIEGAPTAASEEVFPALKLRRKGGLMLKGAPGEFYEIQITGDPGDPASWKPLTRHRAVSAGYELILKQDQLPSRMGFYRAVVLPY